MARKTEHPDTSVQHPAQTSTGKPAKQKKEIVPDSLPRLFLVLGQGFVKMIPKQGLWILLKSVGIFLFIMWLNFYVVAVRNEGYGGGPVIDYQQKPWVWFFNVGANKAAFSMLSFLIPYVLTSLWHQIRALGVKPFFKNLFHVFNWTGYCAAESGRKGFAAMLFAMAVVMPLGLFAQNAGLFITIAVGQFFGYISQNRNLTYLFSRAGWLDFQRIFQRRKPLRDLNPGIGGFLSLGLLLGAVALLLVPQKALTVLSIILFVIFATLGVLLLRTALAPKAVAMLLMFLGVNLVWFRLFGRVFADDAGFAELGGKASNYIRDPGGQMVIKSGVQPGILGTLGGLLGSVLSTAVDASTYVGGKLVDGVKYVGGKVVDAGTYVGGKVVDGVKYVGGKASDAINGTLGEAMRQVMGPDVWDGMWENIAEEVDEAGQQIDAVWEKTKEVAEKVYEQAKKDLTEFAEDVWNNPGVYVETVINGTLGTIKETMELGWELATNPQIVIDTIAGTTGDIISGAQKIGSAIVKGVWTTITDPKKAWEFAKDFVGYENFKNAFDPKRGLIDRLSQYGLGVVKLYGAITTTRAVVQIGGKVAQTGVTQTIKNLGDDVAKFLGKGKPRLPDPRMPTFTTRGIADTSHMNPAQLRKFQKLVKEFGIDEATIRMGGSKQIMQRMVRGEVLPKPHDIMNKTVNAIDEAFLGAPKNSRGLASHFKPTLPSADDMAKMDPKTLDSVWKRYLQRYDEFRIQDARIKDLARNIYNEKNELVRAAKIKLDPGGLIRDAKTGKPFGSDWDLFNLTKGGKQLPKSVHDAFIRKCREAGLPIEHGTLADWANLSDFNKEAYGKMIRSAMDEGVIAVGPDGVPLEKVLNEFIRSAPQ